MSMFRCFIISTFFIFSSVSFADTQEIQDAQSYLLANIATDHHVFRKADSGGEMMSLPGAVLAAPFPRDEHFGQDYQFHWVRDAAISMNEVAEMYASAPTKNKAAQLKKYLINYVTFEEKAQKQISSPGEQTLGQPKYNIDGTIWEGQWGRPQNDGPALRALTMINIATLLATTDPLFVKEHLLPIIKTDLDYIAREWHADSFDIWEEVKDSDHFFIKIVARKALLNGAAFLYSLHDMQRSNQYTVVAGEISASLAQHYLKGQGYYTETLHQKNNQGGGLDTAVLLGALYGDLNNPYDEFSLTDERLESTVYYLRNTFAALYPINILGNYNPPLLGRYANDIYDGDQFLYGNPWILISNALAEYYDRLASLYRVMGVVRVTETNQLFFKQLLSGQAVPVGMVFRDVNKKQFAEIMMALHVSASSLLKTVQSYGVCYEDRTCHHYAEQIDRTSGHQVSARDLTWGYATALRVNRAMGSRR